jgi:hypothetical protein
MDKVTGGQMDGGVVKGTGSRYITSFLGITLFIFSVSKQRVAKV